MMRWLRRVGRHWPPWRQAPDTSNEALRHLAQLRANDAEVRRLAVALREAQRRNHFSDMVNTAISRRTQEGT